MEHYVFPSMYQRPSPDMTFRDLLSAEVDDAWFLAQIEENAE